MAKKKRKKCETCGTRDSTVTKMLDPFTEALYPDEEHEEVTLCGPCATARFERAEPRGGRQLPGIPAAPVPIPYTRQDPASCHSSSPSPPPTTHA